MLDRGKAIGMSGADDGNKLCLVVVKGQPHVYVATLHQPGPTLIDEQRLTYDTQADYPHSWLHDNQTVVYESNRTGSYRLYKKRLQDHLPVEIGTGIE